MVLTNHSCPVTTFCQSPSLGRNVFRHSISWDCLNRPSSTPLLKRTSAPSGPPRRADVGALKISSDVSSQLCPQTRLFSSHTNHSPPAARLPLQLYLRLGCSLFLSLASLENYSFKIQLKCRLLEKNFINSPGL